MPHQHIYPLHLFFHFRYDPSDWVRSTNLYTPCIIGLNLSASLIGVVGIHSFVFVFIQILFVPFRLGAFHQSLYPLHYQLEPLCLLVWRCRHPFIGFSLHSCYLLLLLLLWCFDIVLSLLFLFSLFAHLFERLPLSLSTASGDLLIVVFIFAW